MGKKKELKTRVNGFPWGKHQGWDLVKQAYSVPPTPPGQALLSAFQSPAELLTGRTYPEAS